jgi:tRNA dimethylallyltransferase
MPEEKIEEQLKVRNLLYRKNVVELYDKLKSIDLEAATKIHQNDKKRIIRALEVYQLTGQNITFWQKQKPENSIIQIGDPIYFILTRNREVMYNRIDKRVEEMINLGWIKEVEELVEKGYTEMLLNKAPIGYAEILDFLSGKYDMDELKYKIKKRTRTFARKQVTWFKKEEGIWLNIENEEEAVNLIIEKFLTFEEGVE